VALDGDPVIVGRGRELVPALDASAVWTVGEDGHIAEIDASGARRAEHVLPDGASFVAEVDGGILLETADALEVWEPVSGTRRRVYDGRAVLAASATRALVDGGLLVDLRNGDAAPLWPMVGDDQVHAGAFSPDGSRLAVWQGRIGTQTTGIAVYDVDDPGARRFAQLQSIDGVVADRLVWSPDGGAVYALVSDDGVGGQRVIGIPVGGDPQTVVSVDRNGWYWLAVA
jgi:hypothetical protein